MRATSNSSARVQKLREQRARANAAKAAAASSNDSTSAPKTALSARTPTAPVTSAAGPWRVKDDKFKSTAGSDGNNPAFNRSRRVQRTMKSNISNSEAIIESNGKSHATGKVVGATSNDEWFRYTNGSTDNKLRSTSGPRSSTPQKKPASLKSNNNYKELKQAVSPPPYPKDEGFQSAKNRFESADNTTQHASPASTVNEAHIVEEKKRIEVSTFNTSSSRKTMSSLPVTTKSSKSVATSPPPSRVAANPFISNDRSNNSVENKRVNKLESIQGTTQLRAALIHTNNEPVKNSTAVMKRANSTSSAHSSSKSFTPHGTTQLRAALEPVKNPAAVMKRANSTSYAHSSSKSFTPEPLLQRNMSVPRVSPSTHNHEAATPVRRNTSAPVNIISQSCNQSTTSPIKAVTPSPSRSKIQFNGSGTTIWVHNSLLKVAGYTQHGWEWIRAYLQDSTSKVSITVILAADGCSYSVPKREDFILMGNSWWSGEESSNRKASSPTSIVQFENSSSDLQNYGMPPADLVELVHLHEPAIVLSLRARYEQNLIYTYTGAILLALNPFKNLDHLYTRDVMDLYSTNNNSGAFGMNSSTGEDQPVREKIPPHAYAVAERAYSCMIRSLEECDDSTPCNQSILISGESGAGKTVTTKIIMRYLTIVSQHHKNGPNECNKGLSVENQVLQSNPVLESFGNARTIRNDNSSRFGKFIVMKFSGRSGTLLGASIHFYLLEKVRLVNVNPGERNYHVFYEVLSGMSLEDKKRYMLASNFGRGSQPLTVTDFNMTSMSGSFDRSRDGVQDLETYKGLRTAMNIIGFSCDEQNSIFHVVAALLHASNLRFVTESRSHDDEGCVVYEKDGTFTAVASLLGVSEDALKGALTSSMIEAGGEKLVKTLSKEQSEKALEALMKATYAGLFAFIVKSINESIEVSGCNGETEASIGVLDIFGFESFENNSFEQLCINYCNETLQQQFNRFVFKAEQAEYEYEGIKWSNIQFTDNQEALDLIEDVRCVLDEQCRLPKCTDSSFVRAVYDKCETNAYFEASQMQRSKGTFVIVHYAGQVAYNSFGFLVKNKDELPKSASDLLASSSVPFIANLSTMVTSSPSSDGSLKRSPSSVGQSSVSSQFASQLKDLKSRISQTGPHYIRCLKPNDSLSPDHFDETLIAHQLNCAGVLPAMKLARAGYSMRYQHNSFINRFRVIVNPQLSSEPKIVRMRLTSSRLLSLLSEKLEVQMKKRGCSSSIGGSSNLVSWGVQIGKTKVFLREPAFAALEDLRMITISTSAIRLQSLMRGYLYRWHSSRAIIIQKYYRSYSKWMHFQNIMYLSIWCQRFWRGGKVRKSFSSMIENRAAVALQSWWRTCSECLVHQQVTNASIVLQCAFRMRIAKRMIRRLKREAKDTHLIAQERDRLRVELKQMKLELETMKVDDSQSQSEEIRQLYQQCAKKDQELQELREQVDSLCGNKSATLTLPSTILISRNASPSLGSMSHSKHAQLLTSRNLLDSESNLEELECSRISKKDDSFDHNQINDLELPLHHAIIHNDKKMFLKEVKHSSDIDIEINAIDSYGRTPLHVAAFANNIEFVQLILSHHVVLNSQDFSGNTALHLAKSFDIATVLLQNGINPNIPNLDGVSALHLAVNMMDYSLVKCLLSHGADVTTADDVCWYTPLHLVAHNMDTMENHMSVRGPIAELLCEAKHPSIPDMNYQDREGNTPLHHAASLAEEDAGILISIFIENGACPKIANNKGQTPIHIYCHNNSIRKYVFYHEVLQLMLEKGDPNQQSLSGCTPLHLVLYHNDFISASLLVRFGAEINIPWRKPLKWVAFWSDMESDVVLPLDMIEDLHVLHSLLVEISTPQSFAAHRTKCMHCKMKYRLLSRKNNCAKCGRSICGRCSASLQASFVPHRGSTRNKRETLVNVCILCESIQLSNSGTSVTRSFLNDDNPSELSIGTISM